MIDVLSPNTKLLFKAFRSDHADLARDLLDLRISLSEGNQEDMQKQANRIIATAGAHIAFEEFDFYPILIPVLENGEVSRMYLEHAEGLRLIQKIANSKSNLFSDKSFLKEAISGLEKLEHHVADCGNVFWAVSSLDDDQSEELLQKLCEWHKKAPAWTDIEALSQHPK